MRSFTIIEILLVILVISGFVSLGSFLSRGFIERQYVRYEAVRLEQSLERLQSFSKSGYLSDSWSIYFDLDNKNYILFKGADFEKREKAYDQLFSINRFVHFSDVVFEKKNDILIFQRPYGNPDQNAVISLKSSHLYTAKIVVNAFGVISTSYSIDLSSDLQDDKQAK